MKLPKSSPRRKMKTPKSKPERGALNESMSSNEKMKPVNLKDGGAAKSLKEVPAGKKGKGLSMLPTEIRNNMGFMKDGGEVKKMAVGGLAKKNKKSRFMKTKPVEKLTKPKTDRQLMQFEHGGEVCRGGKSAMQGTKFRGVR